MLIGFTGCGLIAYGLTFLGVNINGLVFFFTLIGGAVIYLIAAMFIEKMKKVIPLVLFVLASM